jgi:hypothetical protein
LRHYLEFNINSFTGIKEEENVHKKSLPVGRAFLWQIALEV